MHSLGASVRRLTLKNAHRSTPRAWSLSGLPHRCLHQQRPLKHLLEKGLGNFLPPQALQTVSVDYQNGLLERVNELVKGTEMEGHSIAQTVIDASTDPTKVLLFNYASQALNNHFFVESLKEPSSSHPNHQDDMSADLRHHIRLEYGSVAQLKSIFSAAALGLSTNGWIWFVTDAMGNTGVIPTFGPSTLLVRSRTYMAHTPDAQLAGEMLQFNNGEILPEYAQEAIDEAVKDGVISPEELNPTSHTSAPPPGTTPSSPVSGVSGGPSGGQPNLTRSLHTSPSRLVELPTSSTQSSPYEEVEEEIADAEGDELDSTSSKSFLESRAIRTTTGQPDTTQIGQAVFPLFCISVHEHAWMSAGYGVWGKEKWLKEFWSVLDWEKVSQAYNHFVSSNEAAGKAKGRR